MILLTDIYGMINRYALVVELIELIPSLNIHDYTFYARNEECLQYKHIAGLSFDSFPDYTIPNSVRLIEIRYNIDNIKQLPKFSNKLIMLYLRRHEFLDTLPQLPLSLRFLNIESRNIRYIPNLHEGLTILKIRLSEILQLPVLPQSLVHLECTYCHLTLLPSLPPNLKDLYCSYTQITQLPELPIGLINLHCWDNKINSYPSFPSSIIDLQLVDRDNCLFVDVLKQLIK